MDQDEKSTEINTQPNNELDTLRELIFGNQARTIQEQLKQVELNHDQQNELLNQKILQAEATAKDDLSQVSERISQELRLQQETIQSLEQQLGRWQAQMNQQLQELRETQETRLEIEAKKAETERSALREEMSSLIASLDIQKSSRVELGDLLVALGEQIKHGVPNAERPISHEAT